jgi:hypothetical protein
MRLSQKEIQVMIAQQIQIAGGGYAIPPVKNCGHPYPAVYDLEEYPKGVRDSSIQDIFKGR